MNPTMTDESVAVVPASLAALVTALCEFAPHQAEALRQDVMRVVQHRMASGLLSAAFNTSLLAYNGSPVEFTASTLRPQAIACTLDPFVPLFRQSCQLSALQALYPHLLPDDTLSPAARTALAALADIQTCADAARPLRFGSWIGRKYRPDAASTKIYAEMPPTARAFEALRHSPFPHAACASDRHALANAGLTLLMLGHYPDEPDAPTEYYYQWHSAEITLADIAAVMRYFGCETQFPALQALLVRALAALPEKTAFPATTYGFSVVYRPSARSQTHQPDSVSLFTLAPGFLGGVAPAAEKMEALLHQAGAGNTQGTPLLHHLIRRQVPLQFNVIGFAVDAAGRTGISYTFSPQQSVFNEVNLKAPRPSAKSTGAPLTTLLRQQQQASGAFASMVRTPDGRWYQDDNAFVTAQVVRTLDYAPETAGYIDKALDFLMRCQVSEGHFSFWPPDAHPAWMGEQTIVPDIDDTAIITELLYKFGRICAGTVRQTLMHMNGYQLERVDARLAAPQHQWASCQVFHTWMKAENDIRQLDCCVNTNALILLHRYYGAQASTIPAYHRIMTMLHNAFRWSQNDYSRLNTLIPYYAHPNEWRVALEYARALGVENLDTLIEPLKKWRATGIPAEIPLYRRHDGLYLWTSSSLARFRYLSVCHNHRSATTTTRK
ncbi:MULTISPECIES: prenyltransferase/squalene oxidase repeat-containing protein [Dickeya]|uniref:Uncharacterized protein n=1 Tax=Dickeya aquatica TaxID=1401087 RepID=A0A375A8Z1_9GAMM|nr:MULTISPECIES: hypothetical protein [Dickeya]SLM62582.1 hypothetical protein DAQ1742_01625 [Dickeya aquatica]